MEIANRVMMSTIALIRALHFAACLLVLGVWGFEWTVVYPVGSRGSAALQPHWRVIARRTLWLAWPAALLTGAGWLMFVAASMSGLSLGEAASTRTLGLVLNKTAFGTVWQWRAIFAAAGIALSIPACRLPLFSAARFFFSAAALVATALFVAGIAWAGHGLAPPGIHVYTDAAHLLAAAFWPGGLILFLLLLIRTRRIPEPQHLTAIALLVRRFSTMSLFAVAILVAAGAGNSIFLLHSPGDLLFLPYGRILLIKIVLTLAAIGLGAHNFFRLKPQFAIASADYSLAWRCMRRNVLGEIGLAAVILLLVGILGIVPPSVPA